MRSEVKKCVCGFKVVSISLVSSSPRHCLAKQKQTQCNNPFWSSENTRPARSPLSTFSFLAVPSFCPFSGNAFFVPEIERKMEVWPSLFLYSRLRREDPRGRKITPIPGLFKGVHLSLLSCVVLTQWDNDEPDKILSRDSECFVFAVLLWEKEVKRLSGSTT